MAYIQGTAESMFDLLEIIKNLATSQGWEVLSDKLTPYNDIPRNAKFCEYEGSIGAISQNISETSSSFRVVLPREISPQSVRWVGNTTATIYGIQYDQTRELIASSVSSGYEFEPEVKAKKYIQIQVVASANINDFHLNFTSENENFMRYLVLSNGDDDNQVILNLNAFISTKNKANIAITTSTGFSPNLDIENQLHAKVGYILGDDESVEYFININHSRIIIFTKILRPDDDMQKNEVWQLCYAGRIRIYGGEWSLPDCNAIIASSYENRKWNESLKCNITNPFVYFSGAFSQVTSTAFSSAKTNLINCNLEAPQGGEIFSTPIICYNSTNVFGELDGLYNVILPQGVDRCDTLSLENKDYLVVADGTGFNRFDSFAMLRA